MGRIRTQLRRLVGPSALEHDDREGAVLGVLSLILLILIDLCYHRQSNLSGSLVVAPVLAAALARPVIVAGVGALAMTASVALSSYDSGPTGWGVKAAVVAAGTVIGVVTARHREVLQDRSLRLKSVAEAAESALLRPLPGRVGPASMAGWHVAANQEARVGGDFYEAVAYGTRARWIIGDALGHGVEAIRLGAAAVGAFREAASRLETLEEVAARVDESLGGFLSEEDFVTAMFAELSHEGILTLINCGHRLPLRLSALEAAVLAVPATRPLGIAPDLQAHTFGLSSGDSLCFHTDGMDEIRTSGGRGIDPMPFVFGLRDADPGDATRTIRDRLTAEVGGHRFQDDVSVLVMKFLPLADVKRPLLHAVPVVESEVESAAPAAGPDGMAGASAPA